MNMKRVGGGERQRPMHSEQNSDSAGLGLRLQLIDMNEHINTMGACLEFFLSLSS
jgi:hypothetical protein